MNIFIIFSALILFLVTAPLLNAMEIRQELYTFATLPVQSTPCETFVITKAPLRLISPPVICQISSVLFEKNSWDLSPEKGELILLALRKCDIATTTPLTITGYTCELGPDQYNQGLSLARARTVADFLGDHGFRVETVQGRGAELPISKAPQNLFRNRRVEITIQR